MPWKEIKPMNQRTEFALKSVETENFRGLCREYGISTKTGYKWKQRLLEHGAKGMGELSRRPKSSPGGLDEAVVCEIIRLKERHRHWGPRKIRKIYERLHQQAPSESSFKRILERAGLVEPRRIRSREAGRLSSGRRAQAPNEVWTVDFKGWWYGADGHRKEPLTVRDEFSRYLLELRAVEDARTETIRKHFEALFEARGLPQAIRSDNGVPFASHFGLLGLSRLSVWWVALGIDLERGRPACPQDNGGHERLHLDVQREVRGDAQREHQAGLDEWRQTFNEERPHEALGMKCPCEVYTKSERKYEGTPADLSYEGMATRRVANQGCIRWRDELVFISTALVGWSLGLQPRADGQWNVWFGRLLLGQLEESTLAFLRVDGAPHRKETSIESEER
jgi:transposase InsO family protein